MAREVTNTEIEKAMFNIGDNKAPGPDGYTSTFFEKAWKVVEADVCLAIKEFSITGKLLVKDIDNILKGFLWCKGEIKRGKAKKGKTLNRLNG
nr:RNA-directed DNA polymerase, eukaryota, reverse transcriptase zinc-binding domain protein [Tanacetum cinerariifolium]